MRYRLADIDLSKPLKPLSLASDETGLAVIARLEGRIAGFHLSPLPAGTALDSKQLWSLLRDWFGEDLLAAKLDGILRPARTATAPLPALTIAICTHDRPERLKRLLDSLTRVEMPENTPPPDILVVDNAPSDTQTREAAEAVGVRYTCEPRTGLNFARNAALTEAHGEYIAYLDDDVTVDQGWLSGFYSAWRANPDAGGFTGLVLPFALSTEAQILFELNGGFRRGTRPRHNGQTKLARPAYPCGSGAIGAGCNMAFRKDLLVDLGGFDPALDTGAPLPGGGDLDIFYRVIRAGKTMAYEPQFAVYHEHRETMAQLKRQYRSWGLGFATYLVKSRRSDPAMRRRQTLTFLWWLSERSRHLMTSVFGRGSQKPAHILAEIMGATQGVFGEYDRSQARIRKIEEAQR